ncbi:TIGR03756 family integrating conjugative element protein [Enterobacteriaceae bacterium H11S18]|uniref:TIGR03756 family integrating conjugative element protein n=1 Tax=Dryocola clanedunensis TaxID=2925396 RepID=UPI0022F0DEDB|nr:TIGR03756 family integrating conjugative element protein [Dryocola clanedunensis]MCT4711351.1 TIGR03756 family integrating conjugative element protein [Dryocola clanedunensis]
MRLNTYVRSAGLALTLGAASMPVALASINTAQIVSSALSSVDCIQWRVSGICYWLFCTPFGCSVRTSVKVTHNIPEVVVSTYTDAGGNPWTEMSTISGASGGIENAITGGLSGMSAGGGNAADQKSGGRRHSAVKFKYADALGHPATSLIGGAIPGYSCDTAATPLIPYFLSTLDALAWRTGVPESLYPEALIPGRREVGNQAAGNMWGNVYPRGGFIQQTDDDKASAVVAQRVADIITRTGEPHVYQALTGQRRAGYWPPPPVTENDASTHTWQRLSPRLSQSCAIFPDGSYPTSANGNEAYALWQPYSCCKRRGQTFLGSS